MRTSKAYFNRFKKEFLRFQQLLGLTQYRIDFFHEKLEYNYAQVTVYQLQKAARVSLNTEISENSGTGDEGPESHARHEVIHLLLDRLWWLGVSRYIADDDLQEEVEAIVVRLEKILK